MDCDKVRQQILQGKQGRRAVQQHLRDCVECQGFARRMGEAEALLETTLPFTAPEALTNRLLAVVPQAAQELRAAAVQPTPAARPQRRTTLQQVLLALMLLAVPVALYLGVSFWEHIIGAVRPVYEALRVFLPLLPSILGYGLGQLGQTVGPAFQFVLSMLGLFLAADYVLRSRKQRGSEVQETAQ